MKMRALIVPVFAAVVSAAGCGTLMDQDPVGVQVSSQIARSERRALESMTLSRLAAIERSLNDYIQAKGRVPKSLADLVPEYLAEIPAAELGIRGMKGLSDVHYYPSDVIHGGQINGALIRGLGGWGYAYNAEQVIVFVDCTRKRIDGTLWYRARGVY